MSPAVRITSHGEPHSVVIAWLATYCASTPGVRTADNATVRLDLDNELQPDVVLRIEPQAGGQSRVGDDDYLEGAPELVVEIAASSATYDLHDKLRVYRRNGVREYVVWRVHDRQIDWFVLADDEYRRLTPDVAGQGRNVDDSVAGCGSHLEQARDTAQGLLDRDRDQLLDLGRRRARPRGSAPTRAAVRATAGDRPAGESTLRRRATPPPGRPCSCRSTTRRRYESLTSASTSAVGRGVVLRRREHPVDGVVAFPWFNEYAALHKRLLEGCQCLPLWNKALVTEKKGDGGRRRAGKNALEPALAKQRL